jgi:hypothetical protein
MLFRDMQVVEGNTVKVSACCAISVGGDAVDGRAAGVAHQLSDSHSWLPGAVRGHLPGGQVGVDVFVQGEPALLDEPQRGDDGDWPADGGGLEESPGVDWLGGAFLSNAIGTRPVEFILIEDGDADAGTLW